MPRARSTDREKRLIVWVPKTELGKKVQSGEIASINDIFKKGLPILESEIVDKLVELEEKVVEFRKTTRVVMAGRRFSFRAAVLVGNRNGLVGIGTAKDAEKWPAIKKATDKAKMNLTKIRRGCGSWECTCSTSHSVPFRVTGKCASVRVTFLPAPKGVGLVAGDAIKDVLVLAGISDVWTKVRGASDTTLNFVRAAVDALAQTTRMRASDEIVKKSERDGAE
ncbi:MAG: 30S ribosomal protein S5 [Candidatus Diapherotrites archaeon]|nr:30S ribosomal protein S5 [Candidatus Diapherotrites archaeon]